MFESTSGQSIGKKILHLKTTGLQGKNIDSKTAVLESFGKAFLLPLDVVLDGYLLMIKDREYLTGQAIQ